MKAPRRYDFTQAYKDPEYKAALQSGIEGIRLFLEQKLREADASGDQRYLFDALYEVAQVYHMLYGRDSTEVRRKAYVRACRRLLNARPDSIQRCLYVARDLVRCGEPKLALRLVNHSYTIVTDARSAIENLNYLREAKRLEYIIQAALDPQSSRTKTALAAYWDLIHMADATFEEDFVEALEATATDKPTNWRDAYIRESVLDGLRGRVWASQQLGGRDRSAYIARVEQLLSVIPEFACPMKDGPSTGHKKPLP